jgi:hypothetical protein
VSYASLGHGHASHVAIESFTRAAGVHCLHVPFKDVGSLMTAVAAGDVDFTAFSMNTFAGLYARGKLRPLAVAARQRLPPHCQAPSHKARPHRRLLPQRRAALLERAARRAGARAQEGAGLGRARGHCPPARRGAAAQKRSASAHGSGSADELGSHRGGGRARGRVLAGRARGGRRRRLALRLACLSRGRSLERRCGWR